MRRLFSDEEWRALFWRFRARGRHFYFAREATFLLCCDTPRASACLWRVVVLNLGQLDFWSSVMLKFLRSPFAALLLVLCASIPAFAQATSAASVGTVLDAMGATGGALYNNYPFITVQPITPDRFNPDPALSVSNGIAVP